MSLRAGIIPINGVPTGFRAKDESVPPLEPGRNYGIAYLNANFVQVDAASLLAQQIDCPVASTGLATGTVVNYQALMTLTVLAKTLITVQNDERLTDTDTEYFKYPNGTIRPVGGEKVTP